MKGLAIALAVLFMSGVAVADPEISYGTPGESPVMNPRQGVCQWGFQDDSYGWGYSLYPNQQLGIECFGPFCVSRVGFYCEFAGIPGQLDIVIYDNGVEVSRTTVTGAPGINEYDIATVDISGTACMMLCPRNFDGVCGEDYDSGPIHSFFSTSCQCSNPLDANEYMWMYTDESSPAETQTWGSIKTLFW